MPLIAATPSASFRSDNPDKGKRRRERRIATAGRRVDGQSEFGVGRVKERKSAKRPSSKVPGVQESFPNPISAGFWNRNSGSISTTEPSFEPLWKQMDQAVTDRRRYRVIEIRRCHGPMPGPQPARPRCEGSVVHLLKVSRRSAGSKPSPRCFGFRWRLEVIDRV
jgi:hypothetical protein